MLFVVVSDKALIPPVTEIVAEVILLVTVNEPACKPPVKVRFPIAATPVTDRFAEVTFPVTVISSINALPVIETVETVRLFVMVNEFALIPLVTVRFVKVPTAVIFGCCTVVMTPLKVAALILFVTVRLVNVPTVVIEVCALLPSVPLKVPPSMVPVTEIFAELILPVTAMFWADVKNAFPVKRKKNIQKLRRKCFL